MVGCVNPAPPNRLMPKADFCGKIVFFESEYLNTIQNMIKPILSITI